jgi:hypothetical protein
LSVDYEAGQRNRLTVGFRIFTTLPILVVFALLGSGGINFGSGWSFGSGGVLFLPTLLMLLFRHKYPGWWFDFNFNLVRFGNRVFAYLLILRDEYPSTDEEQAVHLHLRYPDVRAELNRWMPLVKWFLAIPHYLVLIVLDVGVVLAAIGAWFAILFTGRDPQGLFRFMVGAMRWHNRVIGYAFVLVTDQYPPFRLAA